MKKSYQREGRIAEAKKKIEVKGPKT